MSARWLMFALISTAAGAAPPLETEERRVSQLLRTIDQPPSKEQWVAAGGARVAQTLRAAATRGTLVERRAALAALALFDDEATRTTLRAVVLTDAQPVFRKQAVETLGLVLGPRAVEDPVVVRALDDAEPMVRRAAIRAIARGPAPNVRRLLEPVDNREQDDETKAVLEQARRLWRTQN